MRSAPPVQMTCGRDAWWTRAEVLLHALAAASLAGWLGARLAPGMAPWWTGVAAFAAAAWAWHRARKLPFRHLAWDGREWLLDGQPAQVTLKMAGESWALACARTAGGGAVAWLPVNLARCGAPAHLARAALHAHG